MEQKPFLLALPAVAGIKLFSSSLAGGDWAHFEEPTRY